MSNPLKLGKCYGYFDKKCVYCGREEDEYSDMSNYVAGWLCNECESKTKYKIRDAIWFLHYNRSLDKLEVLQGRIFTYSSRRVKTYRISYNKLDEPYKFCDVKEDYIFSNKKEAIEYGKTIMEVADDMQVQDCLLMQKQNKVYKQIKEFLESDSAILFNIIGIDVKVEKGYVNAEWKFGDREKGDIIQDE